MEDGGAPSEFQGIAAAFAKAKAEQERQEAQGLREHSEDAKQREVRFKATHGLLIAFLLWICLLHVQGIYLFTSGFLLTRLVLEHKSECAIPPVGLPGQQLGSPDSGCWHPKTFEKAVVIIVDALRYDFTVPFRPPADGDKPRRFHEAIPILHETASKYPQNAFLLPFIADPPTTTLQRLKGLTTGTLPTFIDAGSNFAGTAIDEDNLVAQLYNASKKIVHLGDDTWHSLFPGYFVENLTRAYDSFNVWDLHTVDNGVNEHLFPLLQPSNASQWDVIFGHYLGVDHAGHRYGPDHPAMTKKLAQMDGIFRRIIELLDEDTLLVVMGDHGMDAKGDHGGESDDEVEAALWMYSKRARFGRSSPSFIEPPATAKDRPVSQIDLVPTLALLLGMPIPFNNLGAPIEEAFVGKGGDDYQNLAQVYRLAAAQIHQYQHEYSLTRGLDDSATSRPQALYTQATDAWRAASSGRHLKNVQYKAAFSLFSQYQVETLRICRDLWARFDVPSMIHGIEILAIALIILGIYARGLDGDRTELSPVLLVRGAVGSIIGAVAGVVVSFTLPEMPLIHCAVYCSALGGAVGSASALWFARRRLRNPLPKSVWGWASAIFPLLLSIGFASNSFTIWEDEILLFYLASFGMLMLVSSLRQEDVRDRTMGVYHSIVFVVLTRLASLSRLCREEQMPYCKSTYYSSATSSTSAAWQLSIPFTLVFLVPSIIKSYYQRTRSYQGSAVLWVGSALKIGLFLSAIFWTLDAADDGDWLTVSKSTLKTSRTLLAQLILGIAFAAGSSTYAWSGPFLSLETRAAPSDASSPDTTQPVVSEGGRNNLTILGYANVHGTRYFLLLTIWALAAILVQKPMGGGALGILIYQILCLLEIIATNKLYATPVGPVVLALLGSFYFFKTGHQAVLAAIQWESAFIPLKAVRYPWSPLLVVLNTFGAQILAAIAVPATQLWKVPPRKKGLLGDVAMAVTTHVLVYAVINLATTMWAGWLRRHLMLYRIFSPRFMTGAVVLLVVELVAVLVAVGGTRWSFLSVGEVFGV